MRMPHTRYHWLAIALVLVALLLALNDAHGQPTGSTGPAAMFEGRPAMAGAFFRPCARSSSAAPVSRR